MATGDTLLTWEAVQGLPGATVFPALVRRNNHLVLAFDAATDEIAYFEGIMPRHYDGGGVTLSLIWAADTATTLEVVWSVGFERHQDDTDDLDADSFATDQTATPTTASVAGEPQYTDIAFTNGAQMDSVTVGEHFRIRVTRDANNANDDMTGDAHLIALELRET